MFNIFSNRCCGAIKTIANFALNSNIDSSFNNYVLKLKLLQKFKSFPRYHSSEDVLDMMKQ